MCIFHFTCIGLPNELVPINSFRPFFHVSYDMLLDSGNFTIVNAGFQTSHRPFHWPVLFLFVVLSFVKEEESCLILVQERNRAILRFVDFQQFHFCCCCHD